MNANFYHRTETPNAITILEALFAHRLDRAKKIGYQRTETGVWVDWEALGHSWLSSTELATVHIARGIAIAERHGGLPKEVRLHVFEGIEDATGCRSVFLRPSHGVPGL
jgi:hypothetical protein